VKIGEICGYAFNKAPGQQGEVLGANGMGLTNYPQIAQIDTGF
jgi:hypothetical protein